MAQISMRMKCVSRSLNSLFLYKKSQQSDYPVFQFQPFDIRYYSDRDSDDTNKNTKAQTTSNLTPGHSKENLISSSSTLFQNGLLIQELPVLVKRISELPGFVDPKDLKMDADPPTSSNRQNESLNKVIKLHLRQVTTVSEVLQYLLVIPTKDVTPLVALSILERIIELQNDATDEGEIRKTPSTECATLSKLCEVICQSSNAGILLGGLETVIKIRLHFPVAERETYLNIFIKECLQRVHSGKFTLMEICRLIENLFNAGSNFQTISDNVWSEIIARESEINVENVNRVFALLLYLKSSKIIVLSMLEKRIQDLYPRLQQKQVIHMLHILCLLKLNSTQLLNMFSSWTRLNIHILTESGLRDLIMLMNSIQYTSPDFEISIERFMKARSEKCRDALLITALADKLRMFRWRNPVVLECISNFFIRNGNHISSDTFSSLIQVFGYLNYEPTNAFKLFEALEKTLTEKIPDMDPENVICILLSCVYIQRYPLNFVKKLFSPGFLDRLNFQAANDETRRRLAYNNLRLLDVSLDLECSTYAGPYLPRNLTPKSLYRDGRRKGLQRKLEDHIAKLLGGYDFFQECAVIPKLPLNELYIVDYMIILDKENKPLPYFSTANIQRRVAVLLLLPEHFCNSPTDILIGPQAMRIRQLQLIGLKVVPLKVHTLEQLVNSKKELQAYLRRHLSPCISLQS